MEKRVDCHVIRVDIQKKVKDHFNKTLVCKMCELTVPAKYLQQHTVNCKQLKELKNELLIINKWLIDTCSSAEKDKQNNIKNMVIGINSSNKISGSNTPQNNGKLSKTSMDNRFSPVMAKKPLDLANSPHAFSLNIANDNTIDSPDSSRASPIRGMTFEKPPEKYFKEEEPQKDNEFEHIASEPMPQITLKQPGNSITPSHPAPTESTHESNSSDGKTSFQNQDEQDDEQNSKKQQSMKYSRFRVLKNTNDDQQTNNSPDSNLSNGRSHKSEGETSNEDSEPKHSNLKFDDENDSDIETKEKPKQNGKSDESSEEGWRGAHYANKTETIKRSRFSKGPVQEAPKRGSQDSEDENFERAKLSDDQEIEAPMPLVRAISQPIMLSDHSKMFTVPKPDANQEKEKENEPNNLDSNRSSLKNDSKNEEESRPCLGDILFSSDDEEAEPKPTIKLKESRIESNNSEKEKKEEVKKPEENKQESSESKTVGNLVVRNSEKDLDNPPNYIDEMMEHQSNDDGYNDTNSKKGSAKASSKNDGDDTNSVQFGRDLDESSTRAVMSKGGDFDKLKGQESTPKSSMATIDADKKPNGEASEKRNTEQLQKVQSINSSKFRNSSLTGSKASQTQYQKSANEDCKPALNEFGMLKITQGFYSELSRYTKDIMANPYGEQLGYDIQAETYLLNIIQNKDYTNEIVKNLANEILQKVKKRVELVYKIRVDWC